MDALVKAKKEHKYIYILKFDDKHVAVFRALTIKEYNSYQSLITAFPKLYEDIKDDILEDCLIEYGSEFVVYKKGLIDDSHMSWEATMDTMDAGAAETLVSAILNVSGVNSADKFMQDIDDRRQLALSNAYERILYLISSIFKYDIDKLENMYWEDVLKLINQGELIISGNIPSAPFTIEKRPQSSTNFEEENKKINEEYN